MLPDRVSNPGPLTYESGALPTALRGPAVLKKKIFEYFSMYFYGSNLQPLARSHHGPWDLHLNKISKGPLVNAT